MTRIERFKFLQIFGDGNQHNWFQVVFLGVQFLKVHQTKFEKIFKKALSDGIIRRVDTTETLLVKAQMEEHKVGLFVGLDWERYDYVITMPGDECLRNEQIKRDGDVSYYKYYDRSVHGANGVDKYAPLPPGFRPS